MVHVLFATVQRGNIILRLALLARAVMIATIRPAELLLTVPLAQVGATTDAAVKYYKYRVTTDMWHPTVVRGWDHQQQVHYWYQTYLVRC